LTGMTVEKMWEIIANGDLEREHKHLPIDGSNDRKQTANEKGMFYFLGTYHLVLKILNVY